MSRRLRVGYVIGALDAAGSERQMLALAERLPRNRFEPEFLLLSRPGANAARAEASGITLHVIPPAMRRRESPATVVGWRAVQKAVSFIRLVRERRYDIVDAWLFHAYVLAAITRPATRVPILVTGRRSLASAEPGGRSARLLRRFAMAMSDAVVANSPQVLDDVAEGGRPVDPRRLRVIMNGVAVPGPESQATSAALRAELHLPENAVVFGTVANLNPGKGHEIVLEAAANLLHRQPSAYVVLVGDGELRPALEQRVRDLAIGHRVRFAGLVPDAARLLPAFDVVVQASQSEGLPNALLEAAASGRAIVASAVGGTLQVVRDGSTGMLVPPGDPVAVAAAMERLIEDPALRLRLGAAARAHAAAAFGMDRFVGEFVDLYLELAERRGILP